MEMFLLHSEVSDLIQSPHDNSTNLACHLVISVSFSSEMFLFFHVEDSGILVEYAYSFLRLIFNTAQL